MLTSIRHWLDRNILELGPEMRLSFLPPLMVYVAAGVSGLTGIVGTFFVKEHLGLSRNTSDCRPPSWPHWASGPESHGH
ncbi:MAG: hypothetical protein AW12_02633 [Candidatus Accumulibacter sp. BA-94]|nr:MAG: hypothetical protein AW12_02633 [Candidatus Accumulibacter sp. BA-94]